MTDTYTGLTPGEMEEWPAEYADLAFTREEYLGRIRKLRGLMAANNIDLLYVTAPDHVAYLHGYAASWYKASGPMRYPQLYGTAIHVDSDEFIHFDNPTELPVLGKTSVSTDNRFFPSRDAGPCLAFVISELKAKGWLGGTVGLEYTQPLELSAEPGDQHHAWRAVFSPRVAGWSTPAPWCAGSGGSSHRPRSPISRRPPRSPISATPRCATWPGRA